MRRTLAALLVLCLMLALCPVVFAENVKVAVKPVSVVRGPELNFGDIADISGGAIERVNYLKQLRLGEAPAPGATIFLTPQSLEPKLLATRADFSAITWSVPANFKITTSSQPVSGQKIAEFARAHIALAAVGATVLMVEAPGDLQAPLGKLELRPELAGQVRYNGPTTVNVTVRTDGATFAKVPVQFEVKRILEVVVAAQNLNAGDIIQARSVRLESVDAGKLQPGYLTDLSKVVGMQIRQAAPPGSVVFERSLTRPILVKQGEMIRIAARIGEIEVSAGGVAMSQGAAGDLIRVQNLTTKRFLTGRVQEDKSVLVLNYQGG